VNLYSLLTYILCLQGMFQCLHCMSSLEEQLVEYFHLVSQKNHNFHLHTSKWMFNLYYLSWISHIQVCNWLFELVDVNNSYFRLWLHFCTQIRSSLMLYSFELSQDSYCTFFGWILLYIVHNIKYYRCVVTCRQDQLILW